MSTEKMEVGWKGDREQGRRQNRETERLGMEEKLENKRGKKNWKTKGERKTGKQKGKEKLGGQEEKGRPEPTDARATKGTQRRGDNKKARTERL
jgi:hypothetical protein